MFKLKYILALVLLFIGIAFVSAQDIPEKPNPPRLVNDYVGVLNADEINKLESKLVSFNEASSTQIAIVIVNTLNDYEPADYAQRLGEKWGIGQKGKNNGVVILIKPTGGKGEKKVFIAPGYGLEPVIPDATCKNIVENEILPNFRNNDFYKGLDAATNVLISLAKKEFPASEYNKKVAQNRKKSPGIIPMLIVIFVIVVIFLGKGFSGAASNYSSKGKIPFWTLFWLAMMSNQGSSGGHWGNFSSGSGGFGGGGGGGFGGFGGGGFGGGGAGGSW